MCLKFKCIALGIFFLMLCRLVQAIVLRFLCQMLPVRHAVPAISHYIVSQNILLVLPVFLLGLWSLQHLLGMCLELTFPALSAEKLDTISAKTGHSRNELIGIFLEYAAECRDLENKWQSMYKSTCVCKKNLNNAYFRENVENDDVKNTGFNLFLFKDTIVKIEFE